jgi:hypothetical protein
MPNLDENQAKIQNSRPKCTYPEAINYKENRANKIEPSNQFDIFRYERNKY